MKKLRKMQKLWKLELRKMTKNMRNMGNAKKLKITRKRENKIQLPFIPILHLILVELFSYETNYIDYVMAFRTTPLLAYICCKYAMYLLHTHNLIIFLTLNLT